MGDHDIIGVDVTVVGDTDERNALEELLCLLWRDWAAVNIAEAVASLVDLELAVAENGGQ